MDYYFMWLNRYVMADDKTRKASKDHWMKCHLENIKSEREDLIIFSSKMLATWALADELTQMIEKKGEQLCISTE